VKSPYHNNPNPFASFLYGMPVMGGEMDREESIMDRLDRVERLLGIKEDSNDQSQSEFADMLFGGV